LAVVEVTERPGLKKQSIGSIVDGLFAAALDIPKGCARVEVCLPPELA
jgi:hypothetical protein